MQFGNQDQSREDARIQMKREANEQRRLRLLDARKRVIGLDVDALNEQVAEKERMRSDQKEVERIEKLRFLEIDRIMENAADEEKMMKEFQKTQLKQSWDNAIRQKSASATIEPEFNPDSTGSSAAQAFAGEDRQRLERQSNQKAQMLRWIQEQVSEKTHERMNKREEDAKYSELMKAVNSIRESAEIEEKEMQNFLKAQVSEENARLVVTQRESRNSLKNSTMGLSREDQLMATSLNLFNEDAGNAMDSSGRIVRRDMFKGYTDTQRRRIQQENEEVARQARETKHMNSDSDADYAIQQTLMNRAMEYAAWEETRMRNEMKEEYNASLRQQAAEQARRNEAWNKEKHGSIDPNFFSNFGKSCR